MEGGCSVSCMHWVKSWEPQVARLSQWESTALYVGWEQKSERGSLLTLCVFIWARSHKPDINAQHGTAIPPAAQRPRSAVSQPLPFTVPCPLSASAQQWQKDCVSPPSYSSVVSRSPQTSASRCNTVAAPVPQANPTAPPLWHKDSEKTLMRTRRGGWEDNSYRPETTTAVTVTLSFQHLFHAECSGRSVHGMGSPGLHNLHPELQTYQI